MTLDDVVVSLGVVLNAQNINTQFVMVSAYVLAFGLGFIAGNQR